MVWAQLTFGITIANVARSNRIRFIYVNRKLKIENSLSSVKLQQNSETEKIFRRFIAKNSFKSRKYAIFASSTDLFLIKSSQKQERDTEFFRKKLL